MSCAIAIGKGPPDASAATWALCWQAAVGREFFIHSSLYSRVRGRLLSAHEGHGRVLVDYLLLPTEIHAVARIPGGDSPGSVARAFGNVLSRWVREVQPVRSPVLAGPFRSQPILSVEDLRSEARMLAWRPVLLGHCKTPTHYPHGALRILLGLTPSRGFDARPLLCHFGESVVQARAALRTWIRRRPSAQEWRSWELSRGLALATGSVGPQPTMAKAVGGAAAAFIGAGGTYGVDGALRLLEAWVIVKIHPVSELNLHEASNEPGARGRALVACLAIRHRLCSAASVARYFGRAKSTLSEQMAACMKRQVDRQILDTPPHRILEESAALLAGPDCAVVGRWTAKEASPPIRTS